MWNCNFNQWNLLFTVKLERLTLSLITFSKYLKVNVYSSLFNYLHTSTNSLKAVNNIWKYFKLNLKILFIQACRIVWQQSRSPLRLRYRYRRSKFNNNTWKLNTFTCTMSFKYIHWEISVFLIQREPIRVLVII